MLGNCAHSSWYTVPPRRHENTPAQARRATNSPLLKVPSLFSGGSTMYSMAAPTMPSAALKPYSLTRVAKPPNDSADIA
ncbi:hypothetical protein D3C72_2212770 [compost metagenome]